MAKVTQRPYTAFGSYEKKKDASEAAKAMPWPCVPHKSSNGGYGLIRKDK